MRSVPWAGFAGAPTELESMSSNDLSETKPRVLLVYFSHTEQAKKVSDAMAEVLRARGCDVSQAGIQFAAYVVCRRYWSTNLKEVRKLGSADGGTYVDGIRFQYEGGQIRSLLSLLSYFGKGEMRERSLGIKIPPTNLKPDFRDQA